MGSFSASAGSRVASSSRKPSTDETSAKRCSRSQLIRSSAEVCGPRSISTASSASAWPGMPYTRFMLCSKRATRLPLTLFTRLIALSSSRAAATSDSPAFITGSRAVFWFTPSVRLFSDIG